MDVRELSSKVGIGIPTTTDVDNPADTASYVEETGKQFCKWFGGATVEKTHGGYVTTEGKLVLEPIFWVISYCTTLQLESFLKQVLELAEAICRELRQESVAVIINNRMVLVTAK